MQQLKKVWLNVKRYITKYYIAFLSGGVVWMLLDVYAVNGIDASFASFVSAVADTLLVVFAFIALIEARKAWVKRAKEDGYKIAHDLLNYKFINTGLTPILAAWIGQADDLYHQYQRLKKKKDNLDDPMVAEEIFIFIKNLKPCHDALDKLFRNQVYPLSQEIQFDMFRMRNVGVDFSSKDDGLFLKGHFDDFLFLSQECNSLSILLNGYIATHSDINFIKEVWRLEDVLGSEYNHLDKSFEIFNEIKSMKLRLLWNVNNTISSNKNNIHSYFDI